MKARLVIDSTKHSADLFYLTGFRAPDPIIWMQLGRGKILMLSELELDRAKKEASADLFVPLKTYFTKAMKLFSRTSLVHAAAVFLKEKGVKRIEVPMSFPSLYLRVLEDLDFTVRVSGGDFVPARRAKRRREIEEIRKSIRRGAEGVELAVDMIARSTVRSGKLQLDGKPLTSERLKLEVTRFLLDRGCGASGLIAAGSRRQTSMPHHTGSGALRAGEAIILDFFPRDIMSGYHGDITRTVVKGKAGDRLKKMYEATRKVERKTSSMLRPGVPCKKLHAKALEIFKDAGFVTGRRKGRAGGFFHGLGHGLGLEIHEKPSFSAVAERLRCRDVTTIEPGLYYLETGGVRHENVYVITSTGHELLTDCDVPFEIE